MQCCFETPNWFYGGPSQPRERWYYWYLTLYLLYRHVFVVKASKRKLVFVCGQSRVKLRLYWVIRDSMKCAVKTKISVGLTRFQLLICLSRIQNAVCTSRKVQWPEVLASTTTRLFKWAAPRKYSLLYFFSASQEACIEEISLEVQ